MGLDGLRTGSIVSDSVRGQAELKGLLTWEVFFNDSGPQILWKYDFDRETGSISNKTKIIDGLPHGVFNDGMVIE